MNDNSLHSNQRVFGRENKIKLTTSKRYRPAKMLPEAIIKMMMNEMTDGMVMLDVIYVRRKHQIH